MRAFKLNAVFYMNQMYSAISTQDRSKVIERCYWPLLELMETDIPINIQISGLSLEIINRLDRSWIERLRQCLVRNRCELIGNGYAQIIAPLAPAKVNQRNLALGNHVYQSILGLTPTIATVNEMAYSPGIVEHFVNAGYRALYVEWNNPWRFHPEWHPTWRYYRQEAAAAAGKTIPIIWVDSIASQKFQRHAHGELDLDEYVGFLADHATKASDGYLCMYASDTEVFDYRPGRFATEAQLSDESEWHTIGRLFQHLARDGRFEFALASNLVAMEKSECSDNLLRLESAGQPIPVKKQEKYNLYRWALTGRSDLEINTKCYSIYKQFVASGNRSEDDWKKLCYFWSSDFRTHIESERWQEFKQELDGYADQKPPLNGGTPFPSTRDRHSQAIQSTSLRVTNDKRYLTVEGESIRCVFDKYKGLAVQSFAFPAKETGPLFGTVPHGYFDDISLSADFFTGHTIIEKPGEHKITDLVPCVPHVFSRDGSELTLAVSAMDRGIEIAKQYTLFSDEPALEMEIRIKLPSRDVATIHPANFTLIPLTYDQDSLFFATHNGGTELETHRLEGEPIHHAESISSLISAKYGLGATEGLVRVGDARRHINVSHDQSLSALIPSIQYTPLAGGQFFLRLLYSAQETDETFRKDDGTQTIECRFTVT